MKKCMLWIVLCVAMAIGGCEEKWLPADIQALASQQEVLQQQLDTVQAAAARMTEELAAGGIVDPNTVAKLAKINEEADRVQAQISVIAQALKGVPLTGDAAQDFIAQLQAANAASSGFNPYVVPVGAGLSLLSIGLGWLAKLQTTIAAKTQVKYQAHKQGVEKTMKELSQEEDLKMRTVEIQLYENIGRARADLGVN